MKQEVTIEQVNELTPEQLRKLRAWCESKGIHGDDFREDQEPPFALHRVYDPRLTIGQMIEFLVDCGNPPRIESVANNLGVYDCVRVGERPTCHMNALCDALWTRIKEVLA